MKKTVLLLLVLFTLYFPANQASAYLIDTGPSLSPTGGNVLVNFPPNLGVQYLAAEFNLTQPSTITSIEGWMQIYLGGSLAIKIYNDDAVSGDIPGTPTAYSQSVSLPIAPTNWYGIGGLNWSLGSGTYWVAFEAPTAVFYAAMWRPSQSPLINEATYNPEINPSWFGSDFNNMGVRIDGSAVPLPGAVLLLGAGLMRLGLWSRFRKG